MASVAHFLKDAENIIDEISKRISLAEKYSVKYYVNARIIQKHFRGYIERKHIKLVNEKATCIQKNWRAFLGRNLYRVLLKKKFHEMCWAYYYAMATVIQKNWRGYWTRSGIFSFVRLRSWLSFVAQQNKNFKCLAQASQNKNNAIEMKQREVEAKEWIVYILFKLHHLLRTHQLSGGIIGD
ncbi:conserved hypothetical protein [Pediculus humanus corporis]|uniref:Spermatogenesis-associated protein 17 n=1 Tax=Pediculus humanus subsp. corporis TaxID=121224 RepID=E0VL06_PEDHC|nr:uncharacterized protein Phum_PHUM278120 [Pediculus humanus corporis]EEB14062.1 conserved hypothetical protein [Pediculus humanus corporis]